MPWLREAIQSMNKGSLGSFLHIFRREAGTSLAPQADEELSSEKASSLSVSLKTVSEIVGRFLLEPNSSDLSFTFHSGCGWTNTDLYWHARDTRSKVRVSYFSSSHLSWIIIESFESEDALSIFFTTFSSFPQSKFLDFWTLLLFPLLKALCVTKLSKRGIRVSMKNVWAGVGLFCRAVIGSQSCFLSSASIYGNGV